MYSRRGESLYRQKDTLTCMTWHDRKPISFLGTVPACKDDSGVVERSMKVNGHWVKQNFASYGIVSLYNAYMGGVDVSDRRISSYARLMRGAAQYYKIFILSHKSMYFKCAHFGNKISKSYHHNHFSLQKVIDKWLDWRKILQEGHSNAAAIYFWHLI